MDINAIAIAPIVIASLGTGYFAARSRWSPRVADADTNVATAKAAAAEATRLGGIEKNLRIAAQSARDTARAELATMTESRDRIEREREACQTELTSVRGEHSERTKDLDAAMADLQTVSDQRDELRTFDVRTMTLAQIDRALKGAVPASPLGSAPTAKEVGRDYSKPPREKLGLRLGDTKPEPSGHPGNALLVQRIKQAVGDQTEVEADRLANRVATAELHGNKLRQEIKPIMRGLGFEEKRGVQRKGKGAGARRVWRKK